MSSNLIAFIFFYFAIITSVVGYGLLIANAANLKNTHYNKGYLGLFGVFFLIFYLYASHFFISHNYCNNFVIRIAFFHLFF